MSNQLADSSDMPMNMPSTPPTPYVTQTFNETDEDFLERQYQQSVSALERVHALSPGEFERLVRTPARSDEERQLRSTHHTDIARRALIAAQKYLLSEEEFNIWSGRRKEAGQPVKFRFERAYANVCTPLISCKRGALTGIIRAYVRLQDELIAELIDTAQAASSAAELLQVEQQAKEYGFIDFEGYLSCDVAGWPSYPRSTGRFRGATRLRQFFEQRQAELPLPKTLASDLREQLTMQSAPRYDAYRPQYPPTALTPDARRDGAGKQDEAAESPSSLFQRLLTRIRTMFH